jgi:hypothetical protein
MNGKDMKGSGRGLYEVLSQNLLEELRKTMKPQGKPASGLIIDTGTYKAQRRTFYGGTEKIYIKISAKNRTPDLPNTNER